MLGGGLIGDIDDGLIVDDLIGVGQGNVISGAFSTRLDSRIGCNAARSRVV